MNMLSFLHNIIHKESYKLELVNKIDDTGNPKWFMIVTVTSNSHSIEKVLKESYKTISEDEYCHLLTNYVEEELKSYFEKCKKNYKLKFYLLDQNDSSTKLKVTTTEVHDDRAEIWLVINWNKIEEMAKNLKYFMSELHCQSLVPSKCNYYYFDYSDRVLSLAMIDSFYQYNKQCEAIITKNMFIHFVHPKIGYKIIHWLKEGDIIEHSQDEKKNIRIQGHQIVFDAPIEKDNLRLPYSGNTGVVQIPQITPIPTIEIPTTTEKKEVTVEYIGYLPSCDVKDFIKNKNVDRIIDNTGTMYWFDSFTNSVVSQRIFFGGEYLDNKTKKFIKIQSNQVRLITKEIKDLEDKIEAMQKQVRELELK